MREYTLQLDFKKPPECTEYTGNCSTRFIYSGYRVLQSILKGMLEEIEVVYASGPV